MENYHKSKILAILIGILPLIFELSSNLWKGDNGFFIASAAYGLILLLLALSIPLEDLDQWFLEKTLSLLSVFLALTVIINNLDTLLILIISVLTFVFYLIRVMVTFSEQLRPFLLCVYLIVLLISLVWYVPELPEGILGNLSWNIVIQAT